MQTTHNVNNGRRRLFLMALPFILLVFLFNYLPLFGWIFAFFNYKPGIPLFKSPFVGFEYFKLIFSDGGIFNALRNTFIFGFLMIIGTVFPVVFAVFLSEIGSKFFKKLVQTTTTLPYFLSWIIIYSIAYAFFTTDGVFNNFFSAIGLIKTPSNILGNPDIVWWFQTALALWKNVGWNAIIYLAAITGIDAEQYDAASVDGAGRFEKILHVTLPGISSAYIVLLLLNISGMLSVGGLDQYLVFYNSLVADKIEVLDYYVYRIGLTTNDYSYATAIGMFKSVASIIMLFTVNWISKRVREDSII